MAAAAVGGCGLGRALCSSRLPGRHRSGGGKGSRPRPGPGQAACAEGQRVCSERWRRQRVSVTVSRCMWQVCLSSHPRCCLFAPFLTCSERLRECVRETERGEVSQCLSGLCKTCSESYPTPPGSGVRAFLCVSASFEEFPAPCKTIKKSIRAVICYFLYFFPITFKE